MSEQCDRHSVQSEVEVTEAGVPVAGAGVDARVVVCDDAEYP